MATTTDTGALGLFSFLWFDDILDAAPEFIQGIFHHLNDTLNTTGTLHASQWHSEERALQEASPPPRMKELHLYLLFFAGLGCAVYFLRYW